MKIMFIYGPNLNMLGIREKEIYGDISLKETMATIEKFAIERSHQITQHQSNIEGGIVDFIQKAYFEKYDAIIINPAAYTHTSVAILDALKSVSIPTIEVHLSNINSREDYRKHSFIAPICIGQISGFGDYGYIMAINALENIFNK